MINEINFVETGNTLFQVMKTELWTLYFSQQNFFISF